MLTSFSSTSLKKPSSFPHAGFRQRSAIAALLLACALPCLAETGTPLIDDPYSFNLQTSVATRHFHPSPTQNNHQDLLNLEWNYQKDMLVGAATFRNTFRQQTELVYWGAKFRPVDSTPDLYIKVVGGLIHGYEGQYRDKIPFNGSGTAPAIIPAVGYCYKQVCSELIVFGAAGAMATAGVRF
jgi:hypothetical protein